METNPIVLYICLIIISRFIIQQEGMQLAFNIRCQFVFVQIPVSNAFRFFSGDTYIIGIIKTTAATPGSCQKNTGWIVEKANASIFSVIVIMPIDQIQHGAIRCESTTFHMVHFKSFSVGLCKEFFTKMLQ